VQLDALAARWPRYQAETEVLGGGLSPAEMLFFLATIPKMILLEESLDLFSAHHEVRRRVDRYLNTMEPKRVAGKSSNNPPSPKALGRKTAARRAR
jgi:hypothetical protein